MLEDKRTKKDAQHTSVLFTGKIKLPKFSLHISKTTKSISTQLIQFLPYIYTTSLSKLKEFVFAFLKIFTQNYKYIK